MPLWMRRVQPDGLVPLVRSTGLSQTLNGVEPASAKLPKLPKLFLPTQGQVQSANEIRGWQHGDIKIAGFACDGQGWIGLRPP